MLRIRPFTRFGAELLTYDDAGLVTTFRDAPPKKLMRTCELVGSPLADQLGLHLQPLRLSEPAMTDPMQGDIEPTPPDEPVSGDLSGAATTNLLDLDSGNPVRAAGRQRSRRRTLRTCGS